MKARGLPLLILLLLVFFTDARAQVRGIIVAAERSIVVAGDSVRVFARTRGNDDQPRFEDSIQWSTSTPNLVTVDPSGLVTADRTGIAVITGTAGNNIRRSVSIQVVPFRVDILSDRRELSIGESLQFAAVPLNRQGEIIPNVSFQWEVRSAGGFVNNQSATITPGGLLTAVAAGPLTVVANINYPAPAGAPGFMSRYTAKLDITVTRTRGYRLTRLLSNDAVQRSYAVRMTNNSNFAMNGSGQFAFSASLDGLATGLMLYENGRFELLAQAGTPGPYPGSVIQSFNNVSINRRGDVLTKVQARGNWGGLLLVSRGESKYVFLDNQGEGSLERISNVAITRHSLSDNGDIVFHSQFRFTGNSRSYFGLFKLTSGGLQLLASSRDALPGIGADAQFGYFGIDAAGVVYFAARGSLGASVFRADGVSEHVTVLRSGTLVEGTPVTFDVFRNFALSSNGTLAVLAYAPDGRRGFAAYRPANRQVSYYFSRFGLQDVYAATDSGDVYFHGHGDGGWGVYRWRASGNPTPLILSGETFGSEKVQFFDFGYVTESGRVFARVSTVRGDDVLIQGMPATELFRSGHSVRLSVPPNLNNLVYGADAGRPQLLFGGQDASLWEYTANTVMPIFRSGERLDPANWGTWFGGALRNPQGDVYFSVAGNVYRYASGRREMVVRFPLAARGEGSRPIELHGCNIAAANNRGVMVLDCWTNSGNVLVAYDQGRITVLLDFGAPTRPVSPGGGYFMQQWFGSGQIVVDDLSRIYANVMVSNGPGGLFAFENGRWRTVALNGSQIGGRTLTGVRSVQTSGQKLVAALDFPNDNSVIAEYSNGSWTSLIERGLPLPNGGALNFRGRFDMNQRGDMVVQVSANTSNMLIHRSAAGVIRMVYEAGDTTESGDVFMPNLGDLDFHLQDDGRVYLTVIDIQDRLLFYMAEPRN